MSSTEEIFPLLANTHVFRNLSKEQLEQIVSIASLQTYEAGDMVFHQGANSNELYVTIRGEVDIIIDQSLIGEVEDDEQIPITTLRRGEAFGEIALVDQNPRSASAKSGMSDTELLVVPRKQLMTLCEKHPALGFKLMENIASHLASTMRTRTTDMQIREWLIWSRGLDSD